MSKYGVTYILSGTKARDLGFYFAADFSPVYGITEASLDCDNLSVGKEFSDLTDELAKRNDEMAKADHGRAIYVAEIEVVGRLERTMGCFGPPNRIKVHKVRQVGPVRLVSPDKFRQIDD